MLLKAGQLDQDCLVLLRDDSKLQGRLMRQPDAVYQAREYKRARSIRKLKASEGNVHDQAFLTYFSLKRNRLYVWLS